MLQSILQTFSKETDGRPQANPFTWVYGLGRSIIAVSLLSSFVLTDIDIMFDKNILESLRESDFVYNRINLFAFLGHENLIWSKFLVLAILTSVIAGIYPRLTGLLHFWVVYSFHGACLYLDGGDQIATILTAILVPITLLDARANHWSTTLKVGRFTAFLGRMFFMAISLQVAFIYFNTAIEKIYKLDEWTNGTALYYILQGSYFGLSDFFAKLIVPIINSKFVFFLTWWIMISHLALAFALFLKRNDKLTFFYIGLSLHFGIAILMGLYSFSLVMLGGLILYMLPYNLEPWKITHTKRFNILRPS